MILDIVNLVEQSSSSTENLMKISAFFTCKLFANFSLLTSFWRNIENNSCKGLNYNISRELIPHNCLLKYLPKPSKYGFEFLLENRKQI